MTGKQIDKFTVVENFFPVFLMYNNGNLNGFGFVFNADLTSSRYEHVPKESLDKFLQTVPDFLFERCLLSIFSWAHYHN